MGSWEQCDEPSSSTQGGEVLDYLSHYQLLKNDSTAWSLTNNDVTGRTTWVMKSNHGIYTVQ
jgi:hypothetical protein